MPKSSTALVVSDQGASTVVLDELPNLVEFLPAVSPEAHAFIGALSKIRDQYARSKEAYDLTGLFAELATGQRKELADANGIDLNAFWRGSLLAVDPHRIWRGDVYLPSEREEEYDRNPQGQAWKNYVKSLADGAILDPNTGKVELLTMMPCIVITRRNPDDAAQDLMILFDWAQVKAAPLVSEFARPVAVMFPDMPDYDLRNFNLHLQMHYGGVTAEGCFCQMMFMDEDYRAGRRSADSQPFPEKASGIAEFLGVGDRYVRLLKSVFAQQVARPYLLQRRLSLKAVNALVSKLKSYQELLATALQDAAIEQLSAADAAQLAVKLIEKQLGTADPARKSALRLLRRTQTFLDFLGNLDEAVTDYIQNETLTQMADTLDAIARDLERAINVAKFNQLHDQEGELP